MLGDAQHDALRAWIAAPFIVGGLLMCLALFWRERKK